MSSLAQYKNSILQNCSETQIKGALENGKILSVNSVEQWLSSQLKSAGATSNQLNLLGQGAFGKVYQFGPRLVAKVINTTSENMCIALESEALIPNLIEHSASCMQTRKCSIIHVDRTVRLLDKSDNSLKTVIFMQYIDGGSGEKILAQVANIRPELYWTPQVWLQNLNSVFRDLSSMRELFLVHSDIKPENLLFEKNTQLLYLADYGLSCYDGPESDFPNVCSGKIAGTPGYLPMTVVQLGNNSYGSDVFALAITFMELMLGSRFFLPSEVVQLELPMFTFPPNPMYQQKSTLLLFAEIYVRNALSFLRQMNKMINAYLTQAKTQSTPLLSPLIFSSICLILMANPVSDRPNAELMVRILETPSNQLTPQSNPFAPVVSQEQLEKFFEFLRRPPSFEIFYKFLSHIYPKKPETVANKDRVQGAPAIQEAFYIPGVENEYVEREKRDPILRLPRSLSIPRQK